MEETTRDEPLSLTAVDAVWSAVAGYAQNELVRASPPRAARCRAILRRPVLTSCSAIVLRFWYALPGTDVGSLLSCYALGPVLT